MSDVTLGMLGIACLFAAIVLGFNIFVALGLVGVCGLALMAGFAGSFAMVSSVLFSATHSFSFSVIPMFLLMGYFAVRAGLGDDLFTAANAWLGSLRGGLAVSTTVGAAVFGAASGSSIGTATVFTKLALPQMLEKGYDKRLASASIAIAGTLAVMIPPSALMVVYGILTQSNIGQLLIAGVIPGFVFAALLVGATMFTIWRKPDWTPERAPPCSLGEKLRSLRYAGPLLVLVIVIVSGLYAGVFTPSEAGGVGAFVTFVMAIIRQRGLKGVRLMRTLLDTAETSAMVFGIIISALLFSKFLAFSGVSNEIGGLLGAATLNKWVVVALVAAVYLVLGTLMDAPSLLAVTLPITQPVMSKLGFDSVWFGVFVVLLAELGAVTPPVGINCFVVQAASDGRVDVESVFRGIMPYIVAGLIMLVLLCVFPQLALYLPSKMG